MSFLPFFTKKKSKDVVFWALKAPKTLPSPGGGELDKKDRAPSNLLASGAFRRTSSSLADAAEKVLEKVDVLCGESGEQEPLKG